MKLLIHSQASMVARVRTTQSTSRFRYIFNSNDRTKIHWMCSVTTKDQVSSQDLMERMQVDDLAKALHTRRLRWHDYEEGYDGWLKKVRKNPSGGRGRGRPTKTWIKMIAMDCLALGLTETQPYDRKACCVELEVLSDKTRPYTREWLSSL